MLVRDRNRFNDLWWGPWAELERIQDELDRLLFGGSNGARTSASAAPIDVWTGDEGAVVTAAVAGVEHGDFQVHVDGRELTIQVARPLPEGEPGQALRRHEIVHGQLSRSVTLPFEPDTERVEAHYRDGILSVRVPRREADRPRRIEVTAAH